MTWKDCLTFGVTATIAVALSAFLLEDFDRHDVTQICIIVAMIVIVNAVREERRA